MIQSHMLRQTGAVARYLGDTARGPRWASPVSVQCQFAFKRKKVKRANSDEVVSEGEAIMKPGTVVNVKDNFIYAGRTFEVIDVAGVPGPFGKDHHLVVLVK